MRFVRVVLPYLAVTYLKHGRLWFPQLMKGRFPSGHFYNGASQGPDVGRGPIPSRALIDDLWRHVLQSACKTEAQIKTRTNISKRVKRGDEVILRRQIFVRLKN